LKRDARTEPLVYLKKIHIGGGQMTSPGGLVVGGEVSCGGEMVGRWQISWWRDD